MYSFFWKEKAAEEPRIHGVGFIIKNQLISRLSEHPLGFSEHLMTIHLVLANSQMTTVVSAYAPTVDSQVECKGDLLPQVRHNTVKHPRGG